MGNIFKRRKVLYPWGLMVVLALVLMGQRGCIESDPWGFGFFYTGYNGKGKLFLCPFNNDGGSTQYNYANIINIFERGGISSFRLLTVKPTTLILCNSLDFEGKYIRFHIDNTKGGFFRQDNLGAVNFDNQTRSIVFSYEDSNKDIADHTPIPLKSAVKKFREAVKMEVTNKTKDDWKIKKVSYKSTCVAWDRKFNIFYFLLFWREPADVDLIRFYQDIELKVWGCPRFNVRVSFWIQPTWTNGSLGFTGYSWELWVEGGWLGKGPVQKKIDEEFRVSMPANLQKLADTLYNEVKKRVGDKTENIERVSFTLPNPPSESDLKYHNNYSELPPGHVLSTPPIIILQHYDRRNATAMRESAESERQLLSSYIWQTAKKKLELGNNMKEINEKITQVSTTFGPEIVSNIKKMGFEDETEYRKSLLSRLGVDPDSKSGVIIRQVSYNGVPGVMVMGGGKDFVRELNQPKEVVNTTEDKKPDPVKVRRNLKKHITKMEKSSSISRSDTEKLIRLVNKASKLNALSAKLKQRIDDLFLKKTEPYR